MLNYNDIKYKFTLYSNLSKSFLISFILCFILANVFVKVIVLLSIFIWLFILSIILFVIFNNNRLYYKNELEKINTIKNGIIASKSDD